MNRRLSIQEFPRLPIGVDESTNWNWITRPFLASSIMLTVYVFTVIAWSLASEETALYSKLTGLGLTGVFCIEFLLTRTRTVYLPVEFGVLALFVLWNFYSLFWAAGLPSAVTTVKTLIQLLLFWLISVNVMVSCRSVVPAGVGLLGGLGWAMFSAIRSNGMSMTNTPGVRVGSVLTNANGYAVALTMGVLVSLYLYRLGPHWVRVLLLAFIALAIHQIFFFTGSRQGMVGVLVGLAVYFALSRVLSTGTDPRQIFLLLLGLLTGYFALDWLLANSPFASRLIDYRNESSFVGREKLITFAIEQWKISPVIGHGANQFRVLLENRFGHNCYSHNNYLELLVNTGLIGAAIYYGFHAVTLGTSLLAVQRKMVTPRNIGWALTVIMVLLLCDLAAVSYGNKLYWIMFAFLASQRQLLFRQAKTSALQ